MKKILIFNEDEDDDFNITLSASKFACCIDDIKQYIRNRLKYEEISNEAEKDLEYIRQIISHTGLPEMP